MKHVKMVTLAPERVSSTNDVIPKLVKKGITVSIGHSDCTYEEAMEAIKQGANSITHLYSCMRVMHHREPGIIGTISSGYLPNHFASIHFQFATLALPCSKINLETNGRNI